jgi:hypothetical protein
MNEELNTPTEPAKAVIRRNTKKRRAAVETSMFSRTLRRCLR